MPSLTEAEKGELFELPNGLRLYYVDKDHAYYRCNEDDSRGRRYTGVTTAIKPIDFEADGLIKWGARLNAIGIARLASEALEKEDPEAIRAALLWLDPDDPDRIWRTLEDSKLTYEDIRDAKGVVGTNIHEVVLRALAEGKPVPDYSALTEAEKGQAQAVVDFWLDHDPEPHQVEQIVADEALGVAGRFDLRGRFKPCSDPFCPCRKGGIGLVDLKTGKWVSEKDHVQVALYSHLGENCGIGHTDWTGILHVNEDGRYRLWEGQADPGVALSAISLYRHRAMIRNRAGKERKARG